MNTLGIRTAAAVFVTAVTFGCNDVPILPQWDADFYVPVSAGKLSLPGAGTVIPANTQSPPLNGPIRSAPMDGTTGDLLNQVLDSLATNVRIELRVKKSANLTASLADTIYLSSDSAGLASTNVTNGFAMSVGDTAVVDTLQMGAAQVNLIRTLVQAKGTLWMQARGRATTGGAPVTIQATDSIHVRVGLLIAVPVAGGK